MKNGTVRLTRDFWKASDEEWNDWHWQLRNSGSGMDILRRLGLTGPGVAETQAKYPMQVTPFYLSLCQTLVADSPIMMQVMPHPAELQGGQADPFDELGYCHVPRLVHRYRDRALFITTGDCAVHCRHCMRKRNWGEYPGAPSDEVLQNAAAYVREHADIREILISGGDALTLDDNDLYRVMASFAEIDHVEVLRLGSRTPAVMPQRLTNELGEMLDSLGKPVFLACHFNHPDELSPEAATGVDRMLRHGVPVVNQAVLLKGINDDEDVLQRLFTGLLRMKVKPYYLFHGDPIEGTMHFRTGVERGLELMAHLRGHVSGLAIPAFSFDLPEGGGKIRLEPGAELPRNAAGDLCFESFEGRSIVYQ